jgi:hypothetical protein
VDYKKKKPILKPKIIYSLLKIFNLTKIFHPLFNSNNNSLMQHPNLKDLLETLELILILNDF